MLLEVVLVIEIIRNILTPAFLSSFIFLIIWTNFSSVYPDTPLNPKKFLPNLSSVVLPAMQMLSK